MMLFELFSTHPNEELNHDTKSNSHFAVCLGQFETAFRDQARPPSKLPVGSYSENTVFDEGLGSEWMHVITS